MFGPMKTRQLLWLAGAALLLAGAGFVQGRLSDMAANQQLFIEANVGTEKSLVEVLPGGLRALAFTYVWQRSQEQHQAGRHYDARELADLACRLMPNFPGVWSFHAWNMAWNISVTTHTPEERWHWVKQGLELLRDEAIPRNRGSLLLYKEIGWIFFSKMGQSLDDMHPYYKQVWAAQMQQLLGATSYGSTAEVIKAFRPIADAPLDKSFSRQGRNIPGTNAPEIIQQDQLKVLLGDPAVAEYAEKLAARGVNVDQGLLTVYDRYSMDLAVDVVRIAPPMLQTDQDHAISELINSTEHTDARTKLLAFVRAQVLWNVYKMDPQWMYDLMVKFNAPLDWRMPEPHGFYWITYGTHVAEDLPIDDITAINTDRVAMFCLKILTWRGRLVYIDNPENPDRPVLRYLFDWRFIEPSQKEYITAAENSLQEGQELKDNPFRAGHQNYLVSVIQSLYAAHQYELAGKYYEWLRKNYKPVGPEWFLDLEDFVVFTLKKEGAIYADLADVQVQAALQAALESLALSDIDSFQASYNYARWSIYDTFVASTNRQDITPWEVILRDMTLLMLVRPQSQGVWLSIGDRSTLYRNIELQAPGIQKAMYDSLLRSPLPEQCRAAGIDFDKAFPDPNAPKAPIGKGGSSPAPQDKAAAPSLRTKGK